MLSGRHASGAGVCEGRWRPNGELALDIDTAVRRAGFERQPSRPSPSHLTGTALPLLRGPQIEG